ncbi:Translation elongation factor 1 alpha [Spraguea lophii 42_110]|uniref:Translation elongation factor 1 alpha n=1 Tax=Spraguea lophii (strain 42_110) TaxID=1358809 RepID=S7W9K5_SPRLO|nr:Translation elongation factor 1 alpha [Spraguea lophii 42_110]
MFFLFFIKIFLFGILEFFHYKFFFLFLPQMSETTKPVLNACFLGHVDSGKSTTLGHFAYKKGAVDERKMDKLRKEASLKGRDSFEYAFVGDQSEAERARGISITVTLIKVETKKLQINCLDCPGHRDFLKNMIKGAAQADVGVVLVPSSSNEFEAAISGGTLRDHIMTAGVLGVKRMIICVNKLDTIPEADRERRFNEVKDEMKRIATRVHPDKDPIVLPISGLMGTNIVDDAPKFEWFKGWKSAKGETGPVFTLEEAFNTMTPPARPNDQPLRLQISGVLKVQGIGVVATGRIDSGTLKPNMNLIIQPSGVVVDTKTVETHKTQRTEIFSGENCGISFKQPTKGKIEAIKPGDVISDTKCNPAIACHGAKAKVIIVEHPKGIREGYAPVMDIGVHHVPVKIEKILSKRVPGVKEEVPSPDLVSKGESGVFIIRSTKPVVFEDVKTFPTLARFALRDSARIVGIGAVEVKYTKEEFEKEFPAKENKKDKGGDAKNKKARG